MARGARDALKRAPSGAPVLCRVRMLALVALAQAVEPTQSPDGAWTAEVVWPVPLARVRAVLADPVALARFASTNVVTPIAPGRCPRYRVVTGVFFAVSYDMERCPRADGYHESLVASSALATCEVDWTAVEAPGGTRITYRIDVRPTFPAPDFLIDRETRSNVVALFNWLEAEVRASSPP